MYFRSCDVSVVDTDSFSVCKDLVEAGPGSFQVQALPLHQSNSSCSDMRLVHVRELGSAARCQHLNASWSYVLPVSSFLFVVCFIISKYVSTVYYRS